MKPLRSSEKTRSVVLEVEIIEKFDAARAKKTIVTDENLDSPTGLVKKLDPAKMTHSIPDFVSRNQINIPVFCQVLESTSPISKIKS